MVTYLNNACGVNGNLRPLGHDSAISGCEDLVGCLVAFELGELGSLILLCTHGGEQHTQHHCQGGTHC